jgi:hypothetical protein
MGPIVDVTISGNAIVLATGSRAEIFERRLDGSGLWDDVAAVVICSPPTWRGFSVSPSTVTP